jgi:Ca2+:H+ antiporter
MAKKTNQSGGFALRAEWPLAASFLTVGAFFAWGDAILARVAEPFWLVLIFAWLLIVILLSAFAIVRHAECLAIKLGEPVGTLILTLSVIGIEVMMISASMVTGKGSPTLARDAMFSVVMIVLNGLVGLSLVLGGLRFREQSYNLQGAGVYLAMIASLSVLGLILPNFTVATAGPTLSTTQGILLGLMSVGLYATFLFGQTTRHREYFLDLIPASEPAAASEHAGLVLRSVPFHAALLLCYLVPLVILSKKLAIPIDHGIRVMGAPPELGGFIIAALVLSPEAFSGLRAALQNKLQRSVNLLLGSVLATIGLTIPSVFAIGALSGKSVVLGLNPADSTLLALTLAVSFITFTSRRTNVIFGAVHLVLFLAYLIMIFDGQ